MNISTTRHSIINRLTPVVGEREARAMADEIILDVTGRNRLSIALNPDTPLEPESLSRIDSICQRVIAGEPLQYVLGYAYFAGLKIMVTPAVLIPRPETAQLVDMIVDNSDNISDLSVLDICTGSGCIALALARRLRFPHITAVDISPDALAVARDNADALNLNAAIGIQQADALNMPSSLSGPYDIIVSNPPYIARCERSDMDRRVLEHEPALALFVPDSDPLEFYRSIGKYAMEALAPGGTLYFEINPLFVEQLKKMLSTQGWADVEIIRDFTGRNRFARCQR